MTVIFDQETRSFSAIDTREFGEKWKNFRTDHGTAMINTASGIVGAGAGTMIAKAKAKKKAEDMGLEPGTPEYKKFVRHQMLKGGAIGAGAGLATGVVGQAGYHGVKTGMAKGADGKRAGFKAGLAGMGSHLKGAYVDPTKNAWNKVFKKKDKQEANA